MIGLLSFAWLLLLMAAAGWVLATVLLPSLIPLSLSAQLGPTERRRRLWLLAALPWVLPLTLVIFALVLAVAQRFGLLHDHCPYHGPGHPHLCLAHLPQLLLSYSEIAVVALASAVFTFRFFRLAAEQLRQADQIAVLAALSRRMRRLVLVVEDMRVVAFAAGVRKPAMYLSRGLLDQLGRREKRIVVAHEAAHLRHGDLPKSLAIEFLLLLHLPWAAARLRRQWRSAIEEHADDAVTQRFGPTDVAGTLLTISRLASMNARIGLSVAGANPAQRIQRLLTAPVNKNSASFRWLYLIALGSAGSAVILGHHQVETLLGWIV
ncbi:M56 family metallopeptidase [Proteobacteria bacterium 005FR1]|nr:M56 family metallopeptidase [Proteobacteria bacterium 005FR1]